MQENGLSAGTAHHVHRTIRAALNEAVRRRHLARNPVLLAKAPVLDEDDVEPYDVPEIQRLLEAAAKGRNAARWAVALALGLRQGEALGLQWDSVDLDKATIRIRRSRLRPQYEHGCEESCGRPAGFCPQRKNTRSDTGRVKSKAGRRTIGLPPQLVATLRAHQAEQEQERLQARELWHEGDWVFAEATGEPLIPNSDYREWKRLLKEAGLRETRLHDARHTAATVLLALRQPTPTVMSLMGWSSESMAARYQHVTDAMRTQVASEVGDLIWANPEQARLTQMLTVRRDSFAVVVAAAQRCLALHGPDPAQAAGLAAALSDIQSCMSGEPEPPENIK
jgi:integrase